VAGDGLKYEPMTIPAQQAQLIEQLGWTVEDVARAFMVPLYKINSGPMPTNNNVEALNEQYYTGCLQILMESIEVLLDEGCALPTGYHAQFDLSSLLRMDTAARYEAWNKAVGGGWMSPNEARQLENMTPVAGGNSPLMQQQFFSLAALQERDKNKPFSKPAAPPAAAAGTPTNDPAADPGAPGGAGGGKAFEEDDEDDGMPELVVKGLQMTFREELHAAG
jgi:hypothetical protein